MQILLQDDGTTHVGVNAELCNGCGSPRSQGGAWIGVTIKSSDPAMPNRLVDPVSGECVILFGNVNIKLCPACWMAGWGRLTRSAIAPIAQRDTVEDAEDEAAVAITTAILMLPLKDALALICRAPKKGGLVADTREIYQMLASAKRWSKQEIVTQMATAIGCTEQAIRDVI